MLRGLIKAPVNLPLAVADPDLEWFGIGGQFGLCLWRRYCDDAFAGSYGNDLVERFEHRGFAAAIAAGCSAML